jgi:hypothetical protein
VLLGTLAVRGGHDFRTDELKTSFGVGITARLLGRDASLDYGATFSQYLGTMHRFSFTLGPGSQAGGTDAEPLTE